MQLSETLHNYFALSPALILNPSKENFLGLREYADLRSDSAWEKLMQIYGMSMDVQRIVVTNTMPLLETLTVIRRPARRLEGVRLGKAADSDMGPELSGTCTEHDAAPYPITGAPTRQPRAFHRATGCWMTSLRG
jgi:hypothetical protein